MSETIQRNIIRERSSGYESYHAFTTFPVILAPRQVADPPSLFDLTIAHLRAGFIYGFPISTLNSPSQAKVLITQHTEIKNSPLCALAEAAQYRGWGNQQHKIVQKYFLANDPDTIACEVPVWDKEKEMAGCLDILRVSIERQKVEICDFKPDAHKCVNQAMTQVYYYKEMLIKCAGIPRAVIDCYAFDDQKCYRLNS